MPGCRMEASKAGNALERADLGKCDRHDRIILSKWLYAIDFP
jgi:hypothetical protein